MTTLNSALNYNFASAEAARIAQADRAAQESIANQLGQTGGAGTSFVVGTTITARYQYKVAEDGSLVPLQTQITTDIPEDGSKSGDKRRAGRSLERNDRRPSFADLARPRASLSPSEELAVFSAISNEAGQDAQSLNAEPQLAAGQLAAFSTIAAEVSDENGQPVEAEVLTFRNATNDNSKQRAQFQFSVAILYARNNDVVYNVTPISQIAA